jgi:hypothetical protein
VRNAPAILALLLGLAGCTHESVVEQRETPVHVWVSAPAIGARGGSLEALIYVGSEKAVEGRLEFPRGVSTVVLPTLYVNAGEKLVQAVLARGAITASERLRIREESWIHVTLKDRTATIRLQEEQPHLPR